MFFKDITEVKKFVDVNAAFKFELLEHKFTQADRDILRLHFSDDFIDEVQALYDGTTGGNISTLTLAQQNIIKKFRAIAAPYAIALHTTSGQVQIDSSGIFIASNENRKTAFEWQIKDLKKSYLNPCFQAIEDAILFLQKNITDYSTYEASEEFIYYKSCFIGSSKEFTRLYAPLNNSFASFLKLRSCMDKVDENEIKNVLLADYYAELKTKILDDSFDTADKALLPYIKKALANLTASKALSELNASFDENGFMTFDNTSGVKTGASKKTALGEALIRAQESLKASGESYLKDIKKFMEDNISSYPTYANDATRVTDQSSTFDNTDDQNYYAAL